VKNILIILSIGLCASSDDVWSPVSRTPVLGHSASPATQSVYRNTSSFSLVATVTDKDTYQLVTDPDHLEAKAGAENDIGIEADISLGNPVINISYEADTGKRTETYTYVGPFNDLAESGDIDNVVIRFRGKDNLPNTNVARYDQPTGWSSCLIQYHYKPHAEGGGGIGG
jgi:hypothetical protein